MLNCKDYWKRPNNDVSEALFLRRTSLPRLNFRNDNFLVVKKLLPTVFVFSSFGHYQFPARGAGHMHLFHALIGPFCYFDCCDWPEMIGICQHCSTPGVFKVVPFSRSKKS